MLRQNVTPFEQTRLQYTAYEQWIGKTSQRDEKIRSAEQSPVDQTVIIIMHNNMHKEYIEINNRDVLFYNTFSSCFILQES